VTIVATYLITNLLSVPPTLQDMVIQMITTATVGYTVLLHIDLFGIFPLLAFGPFIVVCVLVHFFIQSQKAAAKQKLAKLFPAAPESTVDIALSAKKAAHLNRRQSTQQGVSIAHQIAGYHNQNKDKEFSGEKRELSSLAVAVERESEEKSSDRGQSVSNKMSVISELDHFTSRGMHLWKDDNVALGVDSVEAVDSVSGSEVENEEEEEEEDSSFCSISMDSDLLSSCEEE
jgi:hypothetical protein